MWSGLCFRFFPVLFSSFLAATLPELFQKAKQEFRFGSYAATLATLEMLDAESARPGHEAERSALAPGLLFYRGASLAALGRQSEARGAFEEFLSYQPDAKLDPAIYPRAVIATFESARQSRGLETRPADGSSLAEAYRAFPRPEGGGSDKHGEDWVEGPVRHLLSSEEKRDFERLLDAVARSEF